MGRRPDPAPLPWSIATLQSQDLTPGQTTQAEFITTVQDLMVDRSAKVGEQQSLVVAWARDSWEDLQRAQYEDLRPMFDELAADLREVLGESQYEREERESAEEQVRLAAEVEKLQQQAWVYDPGPVSSEWEGAGWAGESGFQWPIFHATLTGNAVMKTGLMSRAMLASRKHDGPWGLGEGPEDFVSTTQDEAAVKRIAAVFLALAEAQEDPVPVRRWFDKHWPIPEAHRAWAYKEIARGDADTHDPRWGIKERINLYLRTTSDYAHAVPILFGLPKIPYDRSGIGHVRAYASVDAVIREHNHHSIHVLHGVGAPRTVSGSVGMISGLRTRGQRPPPDRSFVDNRRLRYLTHARVGLDLGSKAEQGEIRFAPADLTVTEFIPADPDWRTTLNIHGEDGPTERLGPLGIALIALDLIIPDPIPGTPGPITAGVLAADAAARRKEKKKHKHHPPVHPSRVAHLGKKG